MAKITTLSPVHISTGKNIEIPSYYVNNQCAVRYEFGEVLAQLPPEILRDENVLNEIYNQSKGMKGKKSLYHYLNKIDYTKLNSKYVLKCHLGNDMDKGLYDVSEQVKDLNKPYIPGSSIKGALFNAWFYYFFKTQKKLIDNRIDEFLFTIRRERRYSLFDVVFGKDEKNDELIKDMQACVLCPDLYFEQLELYSSERVGCGKSSNQRMPLPYKECIRENQTTNATFFTINEQKLNNLKKKYKTNHQFLSVLNRLEESTFLNACNVYTQDMLNEEMSSRNRLLYNNFAPINNQLAELSQKFQSENEASTDVILRVGNSTNYNFKCISLFVKNNYPELYEKYFESIFSPIRRKKDGTLKVSSKNMPKTRVVLKNEDGYTLSGFIKVSYAKKS